MRLKFSVLATFWRDDYPGVAVNVMSDGTLSYIGKDGMVDEQWSAIATAAFRGTPPGLPHVDRARAMLDPDREQVWTR